MNRKEFLIKSLSAGALVTATTTGHAQDAKSPLPADLVKEFVIAGHGNFDKTKSMLAQTPALLFATWDWGGGDFETALEGAGHVGNTQIANYLIDAGARTNLFVLTMLGKTALVKGFLEQYPQYLKAKGPHGLSLLHHAQKGGTPAKELFDYLQSKGLTEYKFEI